MEHRGNDGSEIPLDVALQHLPRESVDLPSRVDEIVLARAIVREDGSRLGVRAETIELVRNKAIRPRSIQQSPLSAYQDRVVRNGIGQSGAPRQAQHRAL